ncbi:MAG: hypothetical protein M1546_16275 [Chloroflexi bacterium]|nr:hypothetical protein [Chloroflexota bacterium]
MKSKLTRLIVVGIIAFVAWQFAGGEAHAQADRLIVTVRGMDPLLTLGIGVVGGLVLGSILR